MPRGSWGPDGTSTEALSQDDGQPTPPRLTRGATDLQRRNHEYERRAEQQVGVVSRRVRDRGDGGHERAEGRATPRSAATLGGGAPQAPRGEPRTAGGPCERAEHAAG